MLIAFALLLQAAPAAASPQAGPHPCKLQGARGRTVNVDPSVCSAIEDYFARPPAFQTGLQYDVTEQGAVENCRISEPSGVAELDAKACALMTEKAHFVPSPGTKAKRQKGRRTRITWQTPN